MFVAFFRLFYFSECRLYNFNSESGQMCAIKEVKVVSDDHTSKECLKQLNQVVLSAVFVFYFL